MRGTLPCARCERDQLDLAFDRSASAAGTGGVRPAAARLPGGRGVHESADADRSDRTSRRCHDTHDFCLKDPLDLHIQWFLCGIFNSFVANYLVRLRGGTHVTASIVASLPVPKPARDSAVFARVAALAITLASPDASAGAHAELQARAARLYGCDGAGFSHVLETFPLVDRNERDACARAFDELE